ncbi:MAG: exodeoxyribonuclease VII small subunit [Bacillota bacterium]|nr:exodeoxyribonuclease VII small subunit [Bacillota bacterium]
MENEIKFEDAMKRLEEIVSKLEKGEAQLNESLELFEEGVKLTAVCNKQIEEAERKIKMFIKNDNGDVSEEDFEGGIKN